MGQSGSGRAHRRVEAGKEQGRHHREERSRGAPRRDEEGAGAPLYTKVRSDQAMETGIGERASVLQCGMVG